jgi:hypothetical protein
VPRLDGTGPAGRGSGTGRGAGRCSGANTNLPPGPAADFGGLAGVNRPAGGMGRGGAGRRGSGRRGRSGGPGGNR